MISEFLNLNYIEQALVSYILLFFAFAFIIALRGFAKRLAKRGGRWVTIAKVIFYPFGIPFLIADVAWNTFYAPLAFLERANKYKEGWTLTARMRYHKEQPGMYWQKKVSLFICDNFADRIDPGHCG